MSLCCFYLRGDFDIKTLKVKQPIERSLTARHNGNAWPRDSNLEAHVISIHLLFVCLFVSFHEFLVEPTLYIKDLSALQCIFEGTDL